jgi:peptidoglycan/LPS O-acetylase OafA/YrhL
MRRFGQLSFSLYLIHGPILFTVTAAAFTEAAVYFPYVASAAVASLAGIVATFAVMVAFERMIDRPAIDLRRMMRPFRLRARNPVSPVGTPAAP